MPPGPLHAADSSDGTPVTHGANALPEERIGRTPKTLQRRRSRPRNTTPALDLNGLQTSALKHRLMKRPLRGSSSGDSASPSSVGPLKTGQHARHRPGARWLVHRTLPVREYREAPFWDVRLDRSLTAPGVSSTGLADSRDVVRGHGEIARRGAGHRQRRRHGTARGRPAGHIRARWTATPAARGRSRSRRRRGARHPPGHDGTVRLWDSASRQAPARAENWLSRHRCGQVHPRSHLGTPGSCALPSRLG